MSTGTPLPTEEMYRHAIKVLRNLAGPYIEQRLHTTEIAIAIWIASRAIDDAMRLAHFERVDPDELDPASKHQVKSARRRTRDARKIYRSTAPTMGEVRLLALYALDHSAICMKEVRDALAQRTSADFDVVRDFLADDLLRHLRWLRAPSTAHIYRAEFDQLARKEQRARAWDALITWEASGRAPKWKCANHLLDVFGLAAETPAALRHAWATRDKADHRDNSKLAKHLRETGHLGSGPERVEQILRDVAESVARRERQMQLWLEG
jgi:hypothetical protein